MTNLALGGGENNCGGVYGVIKRTTELPCRELI
jgi:hypothetical protein